MNKEAQKKTVLEIAQKISESRKNRPTYEEAYAAIFSAYLNMQSVLKDLEKIVSRESFYRLYDQMYHEQRDEFDKLI